MKGWNEKEAHVKTRAFSTPEGNHLSRAHEVTTPQCQNLCSQTILWRRSWRYYAGDLPTCHLDLQYPQQEWKCPVGVSSTAGLGGINLAFRPLVIQKRRGGMMRKTSKPRPYSWRYSDYIIYKSQSLTRILAAKNKVEQRAKIHPNSGPNSVRDRVE